MTDRGEIVASGSTQLSAANEIDLICDAFERGWASGLTPDIEEFLGRGAIASRSALIIELILVDREFRVRRGETVSRESYRSRFPDYSTFIDSLDLATVVDDSYPRRSIRRARAGEIPEARIAQFQLLEQLGCGASGTVWKAHDSRLRRVVALKIPRQESLSDVERDRFVREGQAAAQLRHPNIVTVFEVVEDHRRVFIVTEYVAGMDLRNWLRTKRPTARETAELVAQLASALQHAHEQGIVHRDLKPANVLVDQDGRPHITDFGLAKWTASATGMTVQGHLLGTPAYMSPEQARGDIDLVDHRSDVYGLGALLYEMLSGKPMFAGDLAAVVHQVIHDQPALPHRNADSTVPLDLETICLKAIEKDGTRRYASAGDMAHDLRCFLSGDPILARRTNTAERIWRQCRRKPAAAIALLLTVVTSLGGIALASVVQERNRLVHEKYRLEGYQRVEIASEPRGAMIAIAPVDAVTGGPDLNRARIIRPEGLTPLEVYLRPGDYFIEAAITSQGELVGFAEVHRIVPGPSELSVALKQTLWRYDRDRDVVKLNTIRIIPPGQAGREMSIVHFDPSVRQRYPDVPATLLVDRNQTLPGSFEDNAGASVENITYDGAVNRLEALGKRLPTAREMDALTDQLAELGSNKLGIEGLSDEVAEWTSSCLIHSKASPGLMGLVHDVFLLKGFGRQPEGYIKTEHGNELLQPRVGPNRPTALRGVSSGKPRLIKWLEESSSD